MSKEPSLNRQTPAGWRGPWGTSTKMSGRPVKTFLKNLEGWRTTPFSKHFPALHTMQLGMRIKNGLAFYINL